MLKGLMVGVLVFAANCFAQVSPQSFFYTFDSKSRPVANIEVYNHYTDRTVKVDVTSAKVTAPGEKDEKLDFKNGLIVSPRSFTLSAKPKGEDASQKKQGYVRTIRLLLKKKPQNNEEVYRVTFSPSSFTGNEEFKKNSGDKKGIKLEVLIGSGMLIFAQPPNVQRKFSWSKKGSEYTFKNSGNVNLMLTFCQMSEKCSESQKGGRLHAGKEIKYISKASKFKVLKETSAGNFETVVINTDKGERVFAE